MERMDEVEIRLGRKSPPEGMVDGPPDPDFYFVHSFHVRTADRSIVLGETAYQETYPSFVGRSRVTAVQFHPEKSQRTGLALLKNFGAL